MMEKDEALKKMWQMPVDLRILQQQFDYMEQVCDDGEQLPVVLPNKGMEEEFGISIHELDQLAASVTEKMRNDPSRYFQKDFTRIREVIRGLLYYNKDNIVNAAEQLPNLLASAQQYHPDLIQEVYQDYPPIVDDSNVDDIVELIGSNLSCALEGVSNDPEDTPDFKKIRRMTEYQEWFQEAMREKLQQFNFDLEDDEEE